MLQIDCRIDGDPRYILTDTIQPLMLVPDEIRKCVIFVGCKLNNGSYEFYGTAFLVSRPIPGFENRTFTYIITAQHVIKKIRDNGLQLVHLRMNIVGQGAEWVATPLRDWVFHPNDENVDVAVLMYTPTSSDDILTYPVTSFVTPEMIEEQRMGIGDEVFLVGLFSNHYGKQRNIPILRVGNIAAMPEEKVNSQMGPIDAYLVEARSLGGISGSPVFVHFGLTRFMDGKVKFASAGERSFRLLGLMHGHWNAVSSAAGAASTSEQVNIGIAIVVPAYQILETINQPALKARENDIIAILRAQLLPTMDSNN